MTLLACISVLLLTGCGKPTPNDAIEHARVSARMDKAAAQRRTEKVAADRASAHKRQKSWEDNQQKSDAAFDRGISPVDR
jgi:uncharacterized protein YcfL